MPTAAMRSVQAVGACWAIIMSLSDALVSATSAFAASALETSGLQPPKHLLTAEDCINGKPHPEPFLKGAQMISRDITKCLVIEDAPSGIKSGKAAGATVLAVCTSYKRSELENAGADYIVTNLDSIQVSLAEAGGFIVQIAATQ